MREKKWNRVLSLILSIIMVLGMVVITSPVSYADTPTWPQINDLNIQESSITWNNVTEDYNPEYVDYKIVQYSQEQMVEETLSKKTVRFIGEVQLRFRALPTEEQCKNPNTTGIKYVTGTGFLNDENIIWNGTVETDNSKTYFSKSQSITLYRNYDYKQKPATFASAMGLIVSENGAEIKYAYYLRLVEYTSDDTPVLALKDAVRNDSSSATISFTSTQAGQYYYSVYDSKQESVVIDTSVTGKTLYESSNKLLINDLNDPSEKYVYIQGKTGEISSNIIEVHIKGCEHVINHDIQVLDGFIMGTLTNVIRGDFYTEDFLDDQNQSLSEKVSTKLGTTIANQEYGKTVKVIFGAYYGRLQSGITLVDGNRITGLTKAYEIEGWDISGVEITPYPSASTTEFTFTMPDNDVTIQARMKRIGSVIKFTSNIAAPEDIRWDYTDLSSAWGVELDDVLKTGETAFEGVFKNGLVFRADSSLKPGSDTGAYILESIQVLNNGVDLEPTDEALYETGFTLNEGDSYEIRYNFRDKAFAKVTAASSDASMGSASAAVGSGSLDLVFENQVVTLTAVPGDRYVLQEWQVKDADGTDVTVIPDTDDANKATFVMPATGKDITATAVFKVDPDKASSEKALTSVELLDASNTAVGTVSKEGTAFTVTLPADTDVSGLAAWTLKFEISDYASIAKAGDTDPWPAAGQACGMQPGTAATFTVTAENGTTQDYTVVIVKAEPEFMLGDVNEDGKVDANDLTVLSRHVAKIEEIKNATLLKAADVNNDKAVDANDLTVLARYVAKIITAFGE